MEARRLRQARDRSAWIARARASEAEEAGAIVADGAAAGAALAAAAATAAAAADPATCGDMVGQATYVCDGVGMQEVVWEGGGRGKDSGGGAYEGVWRESTQLPGEVEPGEEVCLGLG